MPAESAMQGCSSFSQGRHRHRSTVFHDERLLALHVSRYFSCLLIVAAYHAAINFNPLQDFAGQKAPHQDGFG
jgi:hypothetical protein